MRPFDELPPWRCQVDQVDGSCGEPPDAAVLAFPGAGRVRRVGFRWTELLLWSLAQGLGGSGTVRDGRAFRDGPAFWIDPGWRKHLGHAVLVEANLPPVWWST